MSLHSGLNFLHILWASSCLFNYIVKNVNFYALKMTF